MGLRAFSLNRTRNLVHQFEDFPTTPGTVINITYVWGDACDLVLGHDGYWRNADPQAHDATRFTTEQLNADNLGGVTITTFSILHAPLAA